MLTHAGTLAQSLAKCHGNFGLVPMDRLTPQRRSANMSKVRGKDTGPEMTVRRIAHRLGLRYRLHRKDLPGTPDLVFPRYKLVLFVHGCFWHRHGDCRRASTPATRIEFWEAKFSKNLSRDQRQSQLLRDMGWDVRVIWECEVKIEKNVQDMLKRWMLDRNV